MAVGSYYSNISAKQLREVSIPPKIRCKTCSKWKVPNQYSNKQIDDLKYKIRVHGQDATQTDKVIRCLGCTGVQRTELECVLCCKVKSLDMFAKTHRKNPDEAVSSLPFTSPKLGMVIESNIC